jgi:catalase
LAAKGAQGALVGPNVGPIAGDDGVKRDAPYSILTTSSVLFDAVWVAGGEGAGMWTAEEDAVDFVRDAFKHCKAVGASGAGVELLSAAAIPTGPPEGPDPADDATIVGPKLTTALARRYTTAMAMHRLWTREPELHLPVK